LGAGAHGQTPGPAAAQEATADKKFKCAGTVVDAAGHPVAGATVEYWGYAGNRFPENSPELIKQMTTESNGAFEFQLTRAAGILLARKPGLALAWKGIYRPGRPGPGMEEKLVMPPPAALAGVVQDEANKPVAHAGVFVAMANCDISREDGAQSYNYLTGKLARDCFAARTDASGHFRIENFPTNATAALAVKTPGKALRPSEQSFAAMDSLSWHAGQEDIKLVVEPAGGIEGKIIVEASNQPPPAAQLSLQPENGASSFGEPEQAQSGAGGTFHISDVAAGSYRIEARFGTNPVPEWVAEAVSVSVESGQTTRGAQVTAVRGGLLEVTVLDENDRKPLGQITVNAFKQDFQSGALSDSNGIALLRLPAGVYQVTASRNFMSGARIPARVETGKTNRVEIEIAAPKRITGLVRQPDGQPAAGLPVRLVGGFGPNADTVKTDAAGKFELEWNRRQFGLNNTTDCILVRDAEHNLAVAQDVDEDTGPLDLKLAPGLMLAGRAECDGKPVTNASATLVFQSGQSGFHLTGLSRGTLTPGQFEIPALPHGRKYGLVVLAPGYVQTTLSDVAASAEAGRMELDPVELKIASLKLAGKVLDADGKPVAGAYVSIYGEGQRNANARTDREGRFRFEHVCEGPAPVSANDRNSFGNMTAEGGNTNVVLHLGRNQMNVPGSLAHKLKGTVTDGDGKPAAGAQVAVFPSFNGTHWTKTATNGAFNLTWSLEPWQMQNGGSALLVVRDTARTLAATAGFPFDTTNLGVKLKPALTVAGVVRNADDSPLAGAQIVVLLMRGNSSDQLNEPAATTDAQGRYEIKCLPADAQYTVIASAEGHGKSQQQVPTNSETNRLEASPLVLKLANRVVAGQVFNEKNKPVSGANVSLNGDGQPDGYVTTDSKGRFHFKVCEGNVRLLAHARQGGFANDLFEAGDTNIELTLSTQPRNQGQTPRRVSLKGSPLPNLASVSLGGDAAAAGHALLLCLFDAGQRASRQLMRQLDDQAGALRQQGVVVLGVQAVITSGEILNE